MRKLRWDKVHDRVSSVTRILIHIYVFKIQIYVEFLSHIPDQSRKNRPFCKILARKSKVSSSELTRLFVNRNFSSYVEKVS